MTDLEQLEQCHTEFRAMAAELGKLKSDLAYTRKEAGRLQVALDICRSDLADAETALQSIGYKKYGFGWAATIAQA